MFYYMYKITNLINGKIYIGVHKTSNLNDGYMGSGKIIRFAIKKFGLSNFRKDILEFFDNENDMFNREKQIVTKDFPLREDVYNIRRGGDGGFEHINENIETRIFKNKKARKNTDRILKEKYGIDNPSQLQHVKKILSENMKERWKKGLAPVTKGFLGKKHSDKSKKMIGVKNSKKQKGIKNSQFGTIWINNDFENRKIKKNDNTPEGWKKGRIFAG